MRKSISTMYFTTTAVLLIASILVMGLIQMYLVMEYFAGEREEALGGVADLAASQPQGLAPEEALAQGSALRQALADRPELAEKLRQSIALISRTSSTVVMFVSADGRLLLCSEGPGCAHEEITIPESVLAEVRENPKWFELGNLGGALEKSCYTAGRTLGEGDGIGYVFASDTSEALGVFFGDMFSSFVLSAGMMLLISSILSILFTNRLTGPLRRIAEAARRFGDGDFSVRVPVAGDDEVAQLAVTFNAMARNLEAIDSSRSSFMGNIAHELRTPMTTIKGFIDGMLDGTIPPELQQHYLSLVSQEVGRLARLTQNMLDITKLEAGEYQVNARSYDVWETLTSVVFAAEQRIEEAGVEIQGLAPTRTPVYADPDLVYQVVYNLLDNALKFTPKGGEIRLGVQKNGGEVTVSIHNTGAGIAADSLPFVFDRFYKEDKSRGLNTKGSGLGLHICKVLVGLSGGKIWAESTEGEFCRFSFTLPCTGPDESKNKKHRKNESQAA